ncbi:MAG: Rv3235 family protein, partial [Actinomycetota bacterium]
ISYFRMTLKFFPFLKNAVMENAPFALQPMLNLYSQSPQDSYSLERDGQSETRPRKLYLVPTSHGESYDPDFAPNPSPLSELPNIERWTLTYVVSVLEILAGRRSIQQLARSTHRFTYNSLVKKIGGLKEVPRIRKFHRHQPIEGVVEVTVTLVFSERVRVLAARFEGVDRKWLCTEIEIL